MSKLNKRGAPASRKTHCIALTEQADNHGQFKCFKIVCGSVEPEGKRRPKPFYLGTDRPRAEKLAVKIRDKWKATKASTYSIAPVWSDADLAEIQLWLADQEAPLNSDERKRMLCYDVWAKYIADARDRFDKGAMSFDRLRSVERDCKWIRKILPNLPMNLIDEAWLVKLSRTLKQRYVSEKTNREISVDTVKTRLCNVRMFLKWADRWDYWNSPKLFRTDDTLWRLNRHEKNKFAKIDEAVVLTMDELKHLYDAVNSPLPRTGYGCLALFLLGLNCGFCHAEFSSLKASEFTVDENGVGWIKRHRGKTGVLGEWKLWAETVAAIEAARAADNQWGLLFLNQWNRPCDTASQKDHPSTLHWWRNMLVKHRDIDGFPMLSFKYVRKTASDMVRKLSDFNTAEAFLSHSEGKIARAYHRKDWEKLHAATDALRLALFAAFEPPKMRLAI